ncbi:PLP-dependent aminotransferase family protein [Cytobacillus gottheilii]|uniref:MocR-like pyridoxine biosynthesis transcription factor PdxR n=1 Tax=Cytobacillus gottheilii TaxID=859144 RepID=UPI0008298AFC|nr:PLP-dependent aminotransferase family protein [Cytobacillus gottheilii]
MEWKPDRNMKKPIYKQIAEYIEDGINNGTFSTNFPLPSERKLASQYEVNRSTIVTAYSELEAKGLIERKKGSGTIISRDIWGITKKRIPSWNMYIEAGTFLPNIPVIQRIQKETTEQNLINLATGELSTDLFPHGIFQDVLQKDIPPLYFGYDHPLGNKNLRETIVRHLNEYRDIVTTPESLLVTSGAQQAIHLVIECLLKPGDVVVVEDPSYSYSLPIFKSAGLKVFYLPANENKIDSNYLTNLHEKQQIKMIFLNPIFQNPTGMLLSYRKRKEILSLSTRFGIPIIEDDPYSLMSFSKKNNTSTLKSMDINGNVLYISSLSKMAAPGLRIGWIVGPKSVIERLADAKQQFDFGHSTVSQWIANQLLNSDNLMIHMDFLKEQLQRRRDVLISCLNHYFGENIEYSTPMGGIHLWCKFKKDINENNLLEQSIKEGVIFAPGSTLGSKKGFIRLTYARSNEEQIREGIKRLYNAFKDYEDH